MNTKAAIAIIALAVSSVVSSAAFAQSATIHFTGRIVSPACTSNTNASRCSNPDTYVTRTSTTQTASQANNSAVVTVTYE